MASKDDAGSNKSTAALKVLNVMMEVTGSSMEECRAMLSSCGGDPNRATEQLLASPFQKVPSRAQKAKTDERRLDGPGSRGAGGGRGSHTGSGYGGRGRGNGGRGGGYGDQHSSRDQQNESKGYRGGEGRGSSGRGGRGGGYSASVKAHDTAGSNGNSAPSLPAAQEYSAAWPTETPSTETPAYSAPAAPAVVGSPGAPVNGWGANAGAGKTFAERLKANMAAKAEPAKPPPVQAPSPAQATAQQSAPASPGAEEYHVEEYYVDDTPAVAEDLADAVDATDQITAAPSSYQPPATTWGADAGKLIMSSLKSSTAVPAASEQTLSSSDNPVAPPSTTQHQYGGYTAAPAVAPAEPKQASEVDAMQLSFGTFGIGSNSALGEFGSQFAVQNAYPQASAGSSDSLLKQQQHTQQQTQQPAQQQPQVQQHAPQPQAQQSYPQAAPAQQQYTQQTTQLSNQQQDSMLQGGVMDQYKQNYGGYGLQSNLGGDKVSPPPSTATPTSEAARVASQMPALAYGQGFGQPQAGYGGFTGFAHDMNQPSYAAVQQAFSQDYPDPHKAAAAAYTSPATTGISAGYGTAPGYGAQSAAPPPAATYNQNAGKYMPYGQAPSSTSAAEMSSSQPAATATGSPAAGAIPQSNVPPQQAMYGNPSAAALAPALNPYGYNMAYSQYGNPAAGQNMYAMYAAGAPYGYAAPYSGAYPPQANSAPYPSATPAGNPYAAPNQQQRTYAGSQLPASGYTGSTSSAYGLPGYDDLSGAASQASSGKEKDAAASAGLSGYGHLAGAAGATGPGVAAPGQAAQAQQQQQGGQQAYGAQQQGYNGAQQQGYGGSGRQGGYGQGQGAYGQGQGGRGRGNQGYNQQYRQQQQQQGAYNGMGYGNQGYAQTGYNSQGYGNQGYGRS